MKKISGNIYHSTKGIFLKGTLFFENKIINFVQDENVEDSWFVLPGLIDAHVHIESSMLSPFEYANESLRHGVVASVSDPHEIANVCGLEGVEFMLKSAALTPMKIFIGASSCVPATNMECSGGIISDVEIDKLFRNGSCTHLAEMMNFPGVIYDDPSVIAKLNTAKKYNKPVDGHAPLLFGDQLKKYIDAGISTDHECTTLQEALEKISLGMMIMLRESSASKDFDNLDQLIELKPHSIMFCTDDCHPDDLRKGYIEKLVRRALKKNFPLENIIRGASLNAIDHYRLNVGMLKIDDPADFIVVDNLDDFNVIKTYLNGIEVFDGNQVFSGVNDLTNINNFFINQITIDDIKVKSVNGKTFKVIEIIPDSLLTKQLTLKINSENDFIEADVENDVLKIVVLNRYSQSKPAIGFIKGFGLKKGAIGGSVAHDSHNIVVVGTNDKYIIKAVELIQENSGGLVAVNEDDKYILPLPIAGLMSDKSCMIISEEYNKINEKAKQMGSALTSPFMTLSFMPLLVIPDLKISDKGLFDVNQFSFVDILS